MLHHVRFGSKADMCSALADNLLSATSGHPPSVNYFASQIAAGEKFPSLAFGFKPPYPTILKHHLPVPKCVKLSVEGSVYTVVICFDFEHDESVSDQKGAHPIVCEGLTVNEPALKK